MTRNSKEFPYAQHVHAGPGAESILVERSVQELLNLGSDLLVEIVDLFLDDAAERVQIAIGSFAAGDAHGVGRAAHALKSSSASMGALTFSGICGELERLGIDGSLTSMGPWMEQFQSMHVEVNQALIALRAIYQD